MIYQKATIKDLDEIIEMKNRVKARVVREGLPIWLNGYPLDEMILEDINKANMFMNNNIVDTEYYLLFKEKNYNIIKFN